MNLFGSAVQSVHRYSLSKAAESNYISKSALLIELYFQSYMFIIETQ